MSYLLQPIAFVFIIFLAYFLKRTYFIISVSGLDVGSFGIPVISAFYSALGTIIFPLYACAKEVVRRYKPYLDSLGLTYTKYITMMVLWEYGRMSVKELGERLLTVAPTERGMQLRDDAVEVPKKLGGCIDLSGEEMSTLYRLLYKVLGKNIEL